MFIKWLVVIFGNYSPSISYTKSKEKSSELFRKMLGTVDEQTDFVYNIYNNVDVRNIWISVTKTNLKGWKKPLN